LLYSAMAVVVGFQAVAFSLFSKIFAINEGLLPEDETLNRWFRYVTLEVGLLVGFALFAVGAGGSIFAFLRWKADSFGQLNASRSFRIVIPSLTALILGSEIVLSSFFLSVLGMKRRSRDEREVRGT